MLKAATLNTLNDKIKTCLSDRCWDLGKKESGFEYMLIYQNILTYPIVFKLGKIEVSIFTNNLY